MIAKLWKMSHVGISKVPSLKCPLQSTALTKEIKTISVANSVEGNIYRNIIQTCRLLIDYQK
jgi:hypothetical protein